LIPDFKAPLSFALLAIRSVSYSSRYRGALKKEITIGVNCYGVHLRKEGER